MKIRNILFGYQYQNGVLALQPDEADVVRRIHGEYRNGSSLLNIANQLNAEHIEYMPGVIGWNKSRLARIVEDVRYVGNETYPAIISAAEHELAVKLKANRNTQKETDRTADIFRLDAPVHCPRCGSPMHRRHDSRAKRQDRWTCQNDDCRLLIGIADSDLLYNITEQLNAVIRNPEVIRSESGKAEPSMAVRRLENEIGRMLDSVSFDKAELRNKMLECLSLKYDEIDTAEHITEALKADFTKSSLLSSFSAELFGRTVKSLKLNEDGTVRLTLINGQQMTGKEQRHDADTNNSAENGAVYSSERNGYERCRREIPAAACSGLLPCVNQ